MHTRLSLFCLVGCVKGWHCLGRGGVCVCGMRLRSCLVQGVRLGWCEGCEEDGDVDRD